VVEGRGRGRGDGTEDCEGLFAVYDANWDWHFGGSESIRLWREDVVFVVRMEEVWC
jgi:hypothetical protein